MKIQEWKQMGKRIQDIQTQRGYSSTKLAAKSGLTPAQIRNARLGVSVSLDVIVEIIKTLDVSLDYIVLGIRPQMNSWGLVLRSDDELEAAVLSDKQDGCP